MTASRGLVLMVLRQGRAISTYPSVVNAARMWQQAGWSVDILTKAEPDVPDVFQKFEPFRTNRFPLQVCQVLRQAMITRPDVVIAFEPIDAELCSLLKALYKARYIYHNIELHYPGQRFYFIHKFLEKYFYRGCEVVICQDPLRMGELKKLLGPLPISAKEYYVPNTYMKDASPVKGRYWHQQFCLPDDQVILLYTGSIERKKIPIQLIDRLIKLMPANWSLALWGWSINHYLKEVKLTFDVAINSRRLLIADEIKSEESYLYAVSSASVGLVWHGANLDENPNEYYIGHSSGKFWRFYTLGIPVVSLNRPGLSELVASLKAGIVVDSIDDIEGVAFDDVLRKKNRKEPLFYPDYYPVKIL